MFLFSPSSTHGFQQIASPESSGLLLKEHSSTKRKRKREEATGIALIESEILKALLCLKNANAPEVVQLPPVTAGDEVLCKMQDYCKSFTSQMAKLPEEGRDEIIFEMETLLTEKKKYRNL